MTRRDWLKLTAAAAASFTLATAVFLPNTLNAGGAPATQPAPIDTPRLAVDGCEISISSTSEIRGGEKPSFELVAENHTDRLAEVKVTVDLTSTAPSSPLARTLPRPQRVWSETHTFTLSAGERKTLQTASATALPLKGTVAVSLSSGSTSVLAISSTISPKPGAPTRSAALVAR